MEIQIGLMYSTCVSTVQYGTVLYSTVRYGTVQYSAVQYSTVRYNDLCTYLNASGLKDDIMSERSELPF